MFSKDRFTAGSYAPHPVGHEAAAMPTVGQDYPPACHRDRTMNRCIYAAWQRTSVDFPEPEGSNEMDIAIEWKLLSLRNEPRCWVLR